MVPLSIPTPEALQQQALALYQKKAYAEALSLLEAHLPRFPEAADQSLFFRATLAALTGDAARAVRLLREALEKGQWFMEARLRHPELKSLQGAPEFEALVERSLSAYRQAQAEARPLRITLRAAAPGTPPRLLMHLHGRWWTAERDRWAWEPAAEDGWTVSLLQASEVEGPGLFSWTDRERAASEVTQHWRELCAELGAQPELVLTGFSQGAATAAWLSATGLLPARGVIAVCPGILKWQEVRPLIEAAPGRAFRAYIIGGGQDQHRPAAEEMAELLRARDVPVQLELFEDLGHAYPDRFAEVLRRALAFVAG